MKRKGKFIPDWSEQAPEKGSYRAVFKMGSPGRFKHPGDAWYAMLKEALGMNDSDFKEKKYEGRDPIHVSVETGLSQEQVDWFVRLVGRENVALDLFDRVKYSHGLSGRLEPRPGTSPGLLHSCDDAQRRAGALLRVQPDRREWPEALSMNGHPDITPLDEWIKSKIGLGREKEMTSSDLVRYQMGELRRVIRYVRRNSPFYRERKF